MPSSINAAPDAELRLASDSDAPGLHLDGAAAAQDRGYGALALVLAEPQVRDLGICAVIPEPTRGTVSQRLGEAVSGASGSDLGRRRYAPIILISR